MTDTIFITGVVIHARHGLLEHETEVGQRFVIDLELSSDLSESSRTDRLADTVSYSNVVSTATAAFKNANYKLLERAAGAVADAILAAFPRITAIKVTVHKPHAPIAAIFDDVGVALTPTRQAPSRGRLSDRALRRCRRPPHDISKSYRQYLRHEASSPAGTVVGLRHAPLGR